MASRSTRRPITPLVPSICSTVSAGTRRRRREKRPGGDAPVRHVRRLTETTAAVNSSLDLEEVLHLVADKVADALAADACFVYLYDERTDELVLRATHGLSVDEMTRRPRMRPGE